MVSITSGRAGPRSRPKAPHPKKKKKKIRLGKKAPLPPNFYKIIYIYIYIFKGYAFFIIISDVKNIKNFIIGLQIAMLLITKKVI